MRRIEWPLHVVKRVVIGVLAAVALGILGNLAWGWYESSQAKCGDGVVKRGEKDECVGVTDGAYHFAGHLAEVEKKIKAENDRVVKNEGKEPYVSVAYLASFTLDNDDSNSENSVRHELEGAYLAQYRHNRGDLSASPKIRLLIANSGSSSSEWSHTADELIARKDSERLVSVVGLGPSTNRNLAALKRFSEAGLATVASTMTATNIKDINGFVRVAPTNDAEAKAGSAYLKQQKIRSAVVVQDAAESNLYAKTLGRAFEKEFKDDTHELVADTMTYDSSVAGAWQNELRYMPGQLCDQKPQVVYFAGRGRHLSHFLDAIANRACQKQPFTVLTGDDTTNLTPDELAAAAKTGVDVLYTGLAHAEMYDKNRKAVSEPSARNFRPGNLLDQWFKNDPRYDGQDIMAHDAVLTAAQGIRMASGWKGKVTGPAVARMFHQMVGNQAVPGASGFIQFQNTGDPVNKAIPILQLTADGRSELIAVSSDRGRPTERP
ncbi:branched-chain amino acid ABC transporter substrate-binding protein [Streptomyces sp. NBC_01304]|uniref:branched-chain amino acid ABC transporter substrate-binding protein n=1 Tax=Streptomyces sp. NBC_01304 TaxID=2903818 RepID=UPI002E0F797A|nr:branched-chain amino acid ABC transporter substrate-binding protein [Streptomyces sp. NBC_01304]